jgi:SulP family sulfate permease
LRVADLVDVRLDQPTMTPSLFADLDAALDVAEERLLLRHGSRQLRRSLSLGEIELCEGLGVDDLVALASVLDSVAFRADEQVAQPGDLSSSAWFILAGSMTVRAAGADARPGARLRTVGPGSVLGEMALLSGAPRSAWIHADTDVQGLELSPEGLAAFRAARPEGAATFLHNIACLLGRWLRDANSDPGDVLPLERLAPVVG